LSFVERCLGGDADLADIDVAVQSWHEGDDQRSIYDFLGFTWPEYQLWVEKPESLPAILASRRYGVEVHEILAGESGFALAARAESPDEAAKVLAWLKQTGRM
jgi:hypothetical protein